MRPIVDIANHGASSREQPRARACREPGHDGAVRCRRPCDLANNGGSATGAQAAVVLSPGAKGGPPPTAAVSTPGSDQLSVAVTAPSVLPQGWTIYSAVVAAIRDQDPDTGVLFDITAGEDTTSPYTVVLTGLGAHEYQYRAWLKWNRPDGTFAYSPSIGGQSTST